MEASSGGSRGWRLRITTAVAAMAVLAVVPAQAFAAQPPRSAAAATPADCSAAAVGQVSCAALVTPGSTAVRALPAGTPPAGLSPAGLQDAYGFQASSAGMRQTVAVVTPYDDPTAEADLGTYRGQYSIAACSTADGCFAKVNETGGTSYSPVSMAGWNLADAQSLDMISAVCPNCHILLVEADSPAITDLGQAENEAVALGARFVTNTWSTPEATFGTDEPTYDSEYFDHPGVAITAADGTGGGYGTFYPAASPDVVAVGGTTLTASSAASRGWTETAWSEASSGCSPYEAKPSWQGDTGCTTRMLNDVSADADADPTASPVASYDNSHGGWVTGGGNDVAAAIIAAAFALAGTPAAGRFPASYLYAHPGLINDISTGSDGTCSPAPSYFCAAGTGYDGPTGVGTPASTIPFTSSGTSPAGEIRSSIPDKCLDDYLSGTNDGANIDISTCDNSSGAQIWTVQADGTIRIHGKCLYNSAGSAADNNPLYLDTCSSTPATAAAEQWRPRYPDELQNPGTGKCVNDPGSATANGTRLAIFTCNQTGAQQWAFPYPTPTSTGEVTSGITVPGTPPAPLCLDNLTGGTANGNKVDIWTCNGGSGSQLWTVAADGTLQIQGKCLDNTGDVHTSHNPVQLYTCNGTGAQQWLARSDGSLFNPESAMCLNDLNSATTNGTQLVIAACNETNAQVWTLP